MQEDQVQHYRVISRLGAGGMGEVYLAEDPRLGRQLALKLLPAEFARAADRRARFLAEARSAAALSHPNICTVYDAGETADGRLYIALELLEGETLDARVRRGPLEAGDVVRVGLQLASALEAAHGKGILHRDLKPSNLHLDASCHLKVLDFGLAKRMLQQPASADASTQMETQAGSILGTPQYMSPEQALGRPLDPRSDLFSCGAVLYQLLTGRPPFNGQNLTELLEQILHGTPEAIGRFNEAVPPGLERVVLKCLQKDPEARYQSAQELAADLRTVDEPCRGGPSPEPSEAAVLTWVLLGTNTDELQLREGVHETARMLREFQESVARRLGRFRQARQEENLGSTVVASFARPSNAVQWALEMVLGARAPLRSRAALHLGEAPLAPAGREGRSRGPLTVCERLLDLAQPGQLLMGRAVFDSARQVLPPGAVEGAAELAWLNHGPYLLEDALGAVEVCEVGAVGRSPLSEPPPSPKARRLTQSAEEPVPGWRPAVGQSVPNTPWRLEEKLGEGGFGEVWLAQHPKLKERRVFKFCFRAAQVRALKREMTLFRLLRESVGEHPNIVRLHEVYLDEPPFYLEEEYVEGKDLRTWCEARGGIAQVPLETRLEIVAQAADALQAAHDAGIIHRDVKPGNILVGVRQTAEREARANDPAPVRARLTDFGIGQVISSEYLKGMTRAGFTQTLLGTTSSGTGTMLYLAPELLAGMPATTRSDIYSLGVVLYQLLVGDFRRPTTPDWAEAVPDPLIREDLERCFAWNPEARFAGAAQLAANLRQWPTRKAERERQRAGQEEHQRLRRHAEHRHRLLVASAGVAGVLFLLAAALAYGLMEARTQRERAIRERIRSDQLMYASTVGLAWTSYQKGDLFQAHRLSRQLLAHHAATGLGGWELRMLCGLLLPDSLRTLGPHAGEVKGLGFVDRHRLLTGCIEDARIALWEVGSGRLLAETTSPNGLFDLSVHPGGRIFAVAPAAPAVDLFEVETLRQIASLPVEDRAMTVRFSPDGDHLAVKGDSRLFLLKLAWGADHRLVDHRLVAEWPVNQFWSMAFSHDGRMLAYVSDGRTKIHLIEHGRSMDPARPVDQSAGVVFSPDDRFLAGTSFGGKLSLVDLQTQEVGILHEGDRALRAVAFLTGGRLLAAAGDSGLLQVWKLPGRQPRTVLAGHTSLVSSMAVSPDDGILATGSKDGTCRIWDPSRPPRKSRSIQTVPCTRVIGQSPESRFLLVLEGPETAVLWDLRNLTRFRTVSDPAICSASRAAVDPSGARALLALANQSVVSWDFDRNAATPLVSSGTQVHALAISRDGAMFAVAAQDQPIRVHDASTARLRATLATPPGPQPSVIALWFGPGDKSLLAAKGHRLLRFDVESQRLTHEAAHGSGGRTANCWLSPGGERVASVADDDRLNLWNSPDLSSVLGHLPCEGDAGSVAFDGRNHRIFVTSPGSLVAVLDAGTGDQLALLETGIRGWVSHVQFFAEGEVLALFSNTQEKQLQLWQAPTFAEIEAAGRSGPAAPQAGSPPLPSSPERRETTRLGVHPAPSPKASPSAP